LVQQLLVLMSLPLVMLQPLLQHILGCCHLSIAAATSAGDRSNTTHTDHTLLLLLLLLVCTWPNPVCQRS
jgi:hypothetical protein